MKSKRNQLVHYINTAIAPSETAAYEKLGIDLEEMNVELNPEVETKKNILGETSVNLTSYEEQASIEPYYADIGTGLHTFLQDIIDNRKVLDDVKTDVIEVHGWETATSGAYPAYKQSAVIAVQSYGGDNTGYQIPFTMHFCGERIKGTFNPDTKVFTADTEA